MVDNYGKRVRRKKVVSCRMDEVTTDELNRAAYFLRVSPSQILLRACQQFLDELKARHGRTFPAIPKDDPLGPEPEAPQHGWS